MSKHLVEIIHWSEKKSKEIDNILSPQDATVMNSELFKAVTLYNRMNSIFIDVPNFEVKVDKAIAGEVDYDRILTSPGYKNENSIRKISNSLDDTMSNRDGVATRTGNPGSGKNGMQNIRRQYAKKVMFDASANLQGALYKIITNSDYSLSNKISATLGDIAVTFGGTTVSSPLGAIYSSLGLLRSLIPARRTDNAKVTREEKANNKSGAIKSTAMTAAGVSATALVATSFAGPGIIAGAGLAMYSVSKSGYKLLKTLRKRRHAQADLLAALIEWNQYAIYIIASTDDGRDWDSSSFGAIRDIENERTEYIA